MTETEIKTQLIKKAIEKHPDQKLSPCGMGLTLLDGFGYDADEKLVLYFNIGQNTHAVRESEIC